MDTVGSQHLHPGELDQGCYVIAACDHFPKPNLETKIPVLRHLPSLKQALIVRKPQAAADGEPATKGTFRMLRLHIETLVSGAGSGFSWISACHWCFIVNVCGSSTSKDNSKSDSCHKAHRAPVTKTTAHWKSLRAELSLYRLPLTCRSKLWPCSWGRNHHTRLSLSLEKAERQLCHVGRQIAVFRRRPLCGLCLLLSRTLVL